MGNTKSNPLKYFNDQAESRSKNMGKALKRFQDENSVKVPESMSDMTPEQKKQAIKFGLTFGTPPDKSAGSDQKRRSNVTVGYDEGDITGSYNYTSAKGRTTGVKGSWNPETGRYEVGASYSGQLGNSGPNFSVSANYMNRGSNNLSGKTVTSTGPDPMVSDMRNQSANVTPPSQRKGGTTRKKKK